MPYLDNNKIVASLQIKSLGKVTLKYVSAGDVKKYYDISNDKHLSDREFVVKVLFNQLQQPKIKMNEFLKIDNADIILIGKVFCEAEKLLFKEFEDTNNFFGDFRKTIEKYLEERSKQTEKLIEPFKIEAEKSFQKVYDTIKSLRSINPNISLPQTYIKDLMTNSEVLIKPLEITREENNWQRHKESMDSLNSSLEAQKAILNGQKKASRSNLWLTIIITLIMLIPSVFAAYYGYRGFDLQKKIQNENIINQEYPFFKYSYDTNAKIFKIDSYDYVRINEVKWSFPEYEKEKFGIGTINGLTKDLSWYEIRDHYAMELSQKLTTKRIFKLVQDDVECLFFAYAQEGLPVVVDVDYDLRGQQGLESRDLVLLNRLDTKLPSISFKEKINSDEQLLALLNKYKDNLKYAYEPTIEMVNKLGTENSSKIYDGTCGIKFNQPEKGF
jgi:hypothetical protein